MNCDRRGSIFGDDKLTPLRLRIFSWSLIFGVLIVWLELVSIVEHLMGHIPSRTLLDPDFNGIAEMDFLFWVVGVWVHTFLHWREMRKEERMSARQLKEA